MFKYGQLLISNSDVEVERVLSGDKIVIPKGNKVVVGFDGFAHHLRTGCIQPVDKETGISGYSNTGIIEAVYSYLCLNLPMRDMMDDYNVSEREVKEAITEALEEIGMYA